MRNLFCVLSMSVLVLVACGSDPVDEQNNNERGPVESTDPPCVDDVRDPEEACVFLEDLVFCDPSFLEQLYGSGATCEGAERSDCETLQCVKNYWNLVSETYLGETDGEDAQVAYCDIRASGCTY